MWVISWWCDSYCSVLFCPFGAIGLIVALFPQGVALGWRIIGLSGRRLYVRRETMNWWLCSIIQRTTRASISQPNASLGISAIVIHCPVWASMCQPNASLGISAIAIQRPVWASISQPNASLGVSAIAIQRPERALICQPKASPWVLVPTPTYALKGQNQSDSTYFSSYSIPYSLRNCKYSSWKLCLLWCSFWFPM